jgi:precorrin-2/cobalt-factor-2 C20-methyltransferase
MLIGISLGPGDPGLMTFNAAAALKSCTKVFVPGEMAAELARAYCEPEILQFPMIEDKEELKRIWRQNADTVAAAAFAGSAGFACIGDVNTFSTFSHLERVIRQNHPGIEIETIPGVGVVPTLASRFAAPLEGSFEVMLCTPQEKIIRDEMPERSDYFSVLLARRRR